MFAFTFAVAAMVSAIISIAVPNVGVMHGGDLEGDWRGVFTHKSSLGAAAMLGCFCCGWLMVCERERRAFNFAGVAICLGVAVMSGSRTSVLEIFLFPVMGWCLRLLKLPGILRLWLVYFFILCSSILAILCYSYFDDIMLLLDKDSSVSGRIPLWGTLIDIAAQRPLLGYGYGGFWLTQNSVVEYIWYATGWLAPQAHNSYIDSVLELGVPGVAISCLALGSVIARSIQGMWRGSPTWATFAAIYALALAATGAVETNLMRSGDIVCTILPMLYVSLRSCAKHMRVLSA
jgi:exopolysaccharide production protein ExoQ